MRIVQTLQNRFGYWRLWVVMAALIMPLGDAVMSFRPPWPSMSFTLTAAVLGNLLAIVCSWALVSSWYRGIHWWLIALGMACVLVFGWIYVSWASRYVHIVCGPDDRVVIGSEYVNENMAEFAASNPSKYTPDELIRQFHDVEAIWSQDSLARNRVRLLISWCFCWIGFGLVVSGILAMQCGHDERPYTVQIQTSGVRKDGAGPYAGSTATSSSPLGERRCGLGVDFEVKMDHRRPMSPASVSRFPSVLPTKSNVQQEVILLIHGIRTQAEWQDMVVESLGAAPNALVQPVKYEFFDAFRFWLPFITRRQPIGEILWRIREARRRHPNSRLGL